MKALKTMFTVLATAIACTCLASKKVSLSYGDGEVLEPDDSLTFSLEDELPETIDGYEVLSEFAPDGIEITWTGKKFKAPKKGKVKYSKSWEDFVTTNDENPCGLSVSYSKKTGNVKGSFKVYVAKSEKKVKSYTAKFSGKLGGTLRVTIKKVSGSVEAVLE